MNMKKLKDISTMWKLVVISATILALGWTAQAQFSKKADISMLDLKADRVELEALDKQLASNFQTQIALSLDSEVRQRNEWVRYINKLIREGTATSGDVVIKERLLDEIRFIEGEKLRLHK